MSTSSITAQAGCPIVHRQLSQEMLATSLQRALFQVHPHIAASNLPHASYDIHTSHTTVCALTANPCPPVHWRVTWRFSYHLGLDGEKVVMSHHVGSNIVTAPA